MAVVSEAVAETDKSAGRTAVTVIEAELFFELRSGCVAATCKASIKVPAAEGVTVNCTVAVDGSVIAARSHVMVIVPVHVPWLGCAETNFKPEGKFSVSITPEASCGPSLKTVTL